MIKSVGVLLTTFNRKDKTLACLESLHSANLPDFLKFDIYLTDDNSTDGTVELLKKKFPRINIDVSNSFLYWARGMNVSWKRAINAKKYDAYLLLNDDVVLSRNFWYDILETHSYSLKTKNKEGVYVSTTIDPITKKITYGGSKLKFIFFGFNLLKITPDIKPIECEITNANILFVTKSVVDQLGVFDEMYIHGFADYDYSLSARKLNFPIYVTPNYGGFCINDHGKNWLPQETKLKDRISFLYSPKGLAYREYRYYLKKHFPIQTPYYILMIWMKTFFPFIWDKVKNE
jgi:GT2 family glycosyltransferase